MSDCACGRHRARFRKEECQSDPSANERLIPGRCRNSVCAAFLGFKALIEARICSLKKNKDGGKNTSLHRVL